MLRFMNDLWVKFRSYAVTVHRGLRLVAGIDQTRILGKGISYRFTAHGNVAFWYGSIKLLSAR